MTKTSLITGASSGLGAEYARQLAARGDSLVLVARDERALEALAAELRAAGPATTIEVLAADLLDEAGLASVVARLSDDSRPIDRLINNAGFGLSLEFENNDVEAEVRHLRLHNEVPMRLTHAALQGMLARGSGQILNVASVAAFIPRSTDSALCPARACSTIHWRSSVVMCCVMAMRQRWRRNTRRSGSDAAAAKA